MKNLMSSFFRACLALALLAALLCFAQCKNDDDNGGTTPKTTPDTTPITTPIYLWVSNCFVLGNMNITPGSSCPAPTGGTTGTAAADDVCSQRQGADATGISGTTIALLASAAQEPKDFTIPNKENREIQRPDGTVIAANWTDLFTVGTPLTNVIGDSSVGRFPWTGLVVSTGTFAVAAVSPNTCGDWLNTTGIGEIGNPGLTGDVRFAAGFEECDHGRPLYCVTH